MVNHPISQPAPGTLPAGSRVYAIGDIHGCDARLAVLHEQIRDDLHRFPAASPLLLHLGDYIDRGPDSAAVVRRLAAGAVLPGVPMVCLRGNHEQMLLDALAGDRRSVGHWMANHGESTLVSWGSQRRGGPDQWRQDLAAELPFLQATPLTHRAGSYVFVHAGLRPGVNLAEQSLDDLLWIREGFLDWPGRLLPDLPDAVAVHGHTPLAAPEIHANRIAIDTGAVAGGDLTCAVLEGTTVRFMRA